MDKQKIERFEESIKELHDKPKIPRHSFSDLETRQFFREFWDIHVKPVIGYSKEMANKYDADLEVVWLGAILHDIARLDDVEPHDEIGGNKGLEILIAAGFDREVAEKVKGVILTHRVKKYPPETLEQKIVATADAMAHFLPPFYIWIAKIADQSFSEMMQRNLNKLERDFNEKIFFEDERKMVEKQYEILKNWFEYKV